MGYRSAGMSVLLSFSRVIDWINAKIAVIANVLVLIRTA
jgi:hypothetical protein